MRLARVSGWSRGDIRAMTPPEFDAYLGLTTEEATTTDLLKSLTS